MHFVLGLIHRLGGVYIMFVSILFKIFFKTLERTEQGSHVKTQKVCRVK